MKKFLLAFIFFPLILKGQGEPAEKEEVTVQAQFGKTTYLIFPSQIELFDLGDTEFFFSSKEKNILKIQPLNSLEKQTNMLVKTTQGDYYALLLKNIPHTNKTEYFIKPHQAQYSDKETLIKDLRYAALDKKKIKEKKIQVDVKSVGCPETFKSLDYLLDPEDYPSYSQEVQKVQLALAGIFVNQEHMYFKIQITNNSPVNFKIEKIEFSLLNKGKKLNTPKNHEQEIKVPILSFCNNLKEVKSKEEHTEVLVIKSMTLSKNQKLILKLSEAQPANRHLSLKIPLYY